MHGFAEATELWKLSRGGCSRALNTAVPPRALVDVTPVGTMSPGTSSGFNAAPFDFWARSSPGISPESPGLVDIGHWWIFSPQIIHEGCEHSPEQKSIASVGRGMIMLGAKKFRPFRGALKHCSLESQTRFTNCRGRRGRK